MFKSSKHSFGIKDRQTNIFEKNPCYDEILRLIYGKHGVCKDNGKGVPLSAQKTIFQPGFTTKERGWGLGLSLVKRIVEGHHNGKIYVASSKINSGTVLEIILPAIN